MIFLSCSFDENGKMLAKYVQQVLTKANIETYMAGQFTPHPPDEMIEQKITECEAFLAIVTDPPRPYVHNEIGIAVGKQKPIFALVQKGVTDLGIIPAKTTYRTFDPYQPKTIIDSLNELTKWLQEKRLGAVIGLGLGVLAFIGLLWLGSK